MSTLYLGAMLLLWAAVLAYVAWKPALFFEFPYFMAATFVVFILPQAFSLIRFPGGMSIAAVDNVLLMTLLCYGACMAGYKLPPLMWGVQFLNRPTDPKRLFHFGVFLCAFGGLALALLPKTDVQFASRGGMTGIHTIYLFFGALAFPGFAICLLLLRQQFSLMRLIVVLASAVVPVMAVYNGRRENAVMLVLTLALTRYYTKGKPMPRVAILVAVLFAMVAIPATGAYRSLLAQGKASEVTKLDLWGNFNEFFTQESILELRNAAALMRSTDVVGKYGLGTGYWNQIVYRFVPAQLVGKDVKDGLMIGSTVEKVYATKLALAYEIPQGSTLTGMGDSYEQFGWLGWIFFFMLARVFKTVWISSLLPDGIFAQLFYLMICSSAMRTVTHQTVDFLPGMVYQLVFLRLGLWYAAIPLRDLPAAPAPALQGRSRAIPMRARGRR